MTRLRLTGGNPNHPFMTVPEVAALLRVSRMTVYRLVESGGLDHVRVGRSIRVVRDSVQRTLDNRQQREAAS